MSKSQYTQKFRKEWLKNPDFKSWLMEVPDNKTKGKCKFCGCFITAKLTDINNHAKSRKHHTNSVAMGSLQSGTQKTLQLMPASNKTTEAEGRLALFICAHTSVLSVDHLGEMCKCAFNDSVAASQLNLHRTKCSGIIQCVLYPHFQSDILNRIKSGTGKYSLLLDESTDISVAKLLGIAIIYFDSVLGKIVSTFLSLTELHECSAQGIADSVKGTLSLFNLPLQNLVGIGTDNANVMVGVNNGLYQILKADIPNLILIRCVCHSLQLAVSQASMITLPRNLEFLISETYNWFSNSPLRQGKYKVLYNTINDGCDPKRIVKSCKTRWLSIEVAVTRIIEQYEELKLHFRLARSSEKCYTAELLHSMYSDETNLAYMLFLSPILSEIQQVNKSYEARNADPTKLLKDLTLLINSIGKKLILPSCRLDPLTSEIEGFFDPNPYLGYRFENKVLELQRANQIPTSEEQALRERCRQFLFQLFIQLKQRLPENMKTLEKICLFSVVNILRAVKEPITPILEEMKIPANVIELIVQQYNKINLVDWSEKQDTVIFWKEVHSFKDCTGENPFKEISEIVLRLLILPWSNAEVERIFSQLNIIKNKARNRLGIKMINSIMSVRYGLQRHGKCCKDYVLPDSVLAIIGTKKAYPDVCHDVGDVFCNILTE